MGLQEKIRDLNDYESRLQAESESSLSARAKRIEEIKQKVHMKIIEDLSDVIFKKNITDYELKLKVSNSAQQMVFESEFPLTHDERNRVTSQIVDDIVGYGPIEELLRDKEVTEIMINNPSTIYIEKKGKIYKTDRTFLDENHLMRIIDKIVSRIGRRVDEASPYVDARLPDGSRVNIIIAPLALNGSVMTVRKFAADPFKAEDLIKMDTFTNKVAEFLKACVKGRINILISGGTGTGKTTFLNVVSSFLPDNERIVTIEDAAELQLSQTHVIRLESRPPNIEGKGAVTIRDLVRNALRMRPDRIVVGEVRGGEALDMLQAMNTGHDGSLSTVHANSPRDVLSRLETMVLMGGVDLPVRAIREQISSAINLIVHMNRLKDGSRKVVKISEVQGMEGDIITLQEIFQFDYSAGFDENGNYKGKIKATGLRPQFMRRINDYGVEIPASVFAEEQ
ncbi:MAG: CpaF family protein [Actinobacteria bacterium]|nr:CpaF family protein [Actinomycetota bacterium]